MSIANRIKVDCPQCGFEVETMATVWQNTDVFETQCQRCGCRFDDESCAIITDPSDIARAALARLQDCEKLPL